MNNTKKAEEKRKGRNKKNDKNTIGEIIGRFQEIYCTKYHLAVDCAAVSYGSHCIRGNFAGTGNKRRGTRDLYGSDSRDHRFIHGRPIFM